MNLNQFNDSLTLDPKGRYFTTKAWQAVTGEYATLCFECVANRADTIRDVLINSEVYGGSMAFWEPKGTAVVTQTVTLSSIQQVECYNCGEEVAA